MRNFRSATSLLWFVKVSTAAFASVIGLSLSAGAIRKMLLRAAAVVGYAPKKSGLYPDSRPRLGPRSQNLSARRPAHEDSVRQDSSCDSRDCLSDVLRPGLSPAGRTLRICGLQHKLAVLAGSGIGIGRFGETIGRQSRADGTGEFLHERRSHRVSASRGAKTGRDFAFGIESGSLSRWH